MMKPLNSDRVILILKLKNYCLTFDEETVERSTSKTTQSNRCILMVDKLIFEMRSTAR